MKKWIIILILGAVAYGCCDEVEPIDPSDDLTGIAYNPTSWTVDLPDTWPDLVIPADNPMTEEGIDLGRHLFYDKILSADNTQSCASCHSPVGAFTDNLAVSVGIDGIAGVRSSMSLVNIGLVQPVQDDTLGFLFWDGRSKSLEEQALLPVEDPIELHNEWTTVVKELKTSELYPAKFRKAFGINSKQDITKDLAAKAIAQFERSLLSFNSKYDRIERGELSYSDDEFDGFLRFIDDDDVAFQKQMECDHCHTLPLTTSNGFDNNALQAAETLLDFADEGRGKVVGSIAKNGFFRIPTLRNIMQSAPYMHNGSLASIDEVLDHYLLGGHHSPNANSFIRDAALGKKEYTANDRLYIKAFLSTFTDTAFLNNPSIQDPFQ